LAHLATYLPLPRQCDPTHQSELSNAADDYASLSDSVTVPSMTASLPALCMRKFGRLGNCMQLTTVISLI